MKKYVITLLFFCGLLLYGCKGSDPVVEPAELLPVLTGDFTTKTLNYGSSDVSIVNTQYCSKSLTVQGVPIAGTSITIDLKYLTRDTTVVIIGTNSTGSVTQSITRKVTDWKLSTIGLLTHKPLWQITHSYLINKSDKTIIGEYDISKDPTDSYSYKLNGSVIYYRNGNYFDTYQWVISNGYIVRGQVSDYILSISPTELILISPLVGSPDHEVEEKYN